jgi:hypothetical protein
MSPAGGGFYRNWRAGTTRESDDGEDVKTTTSTEVTVEREDIFIIRKPVRGVTIWCAACGWRSPMLTLEEAMGVTGESSRAIHRQVEAGRIHFAETEEGTLSICLDSLSHL